MRNQHVASAGAIATRTQCGFNPEAMPEASMDLAYSLRMDQARVPKRNVREAASARDQTSASAAMEPTELNGPILGDWGKR